MLLASIKKLIDRARSFLVGKIPDPKGQIDQITTALIYKYMDDLDQAAVSNKKIDGKAHFFVGDLEKHAWHKLFNPKLSNQEKALLYTEGIEKLSRAKHLPPLFKGIFKDAFVPFRAPDTISQFLNEINQFPPYQQNSEDIGNAFEYLLHFMGTQGDAGQFRTPRNIIDFIVDVVAPQKDEKILDPACGTAGFLVSAYQYIIKEFNNLAPLERATLAKNIEGIDLDPQMAKFARVNLYLHGFNTPDIKEDDSLTNENLWRKKLYNVIFANPPFMTPAGGIQPHDKFGITAKRSEVLFVDYICEHLLLQGRAGVIVPEGIVFQSAKAYKELRKKLVNDWGLYAVVSLPSGVFNPYSGVKTSILFIDREFSKSCNDILFVKVENDGYDLGAQRRVIDKNDLPDALNVIQQWKEAQKISAKYEALAHSVSKQEIAKSGEYNLTGDRYRIANDYQDAAWPIVELGEACMIYNGATPKRTEKKYWEKGAIPWFTIEDIREQGRNISYTKQKITESGFKNSSVKLLPKNTVLLCCTASVGEFAFAEIDLTTNQQFNGLVIKEEFGNKLSPKFLFQISSTFKSELERLSGKTSFNFVSIGNLKKIKIPLPPLEVQEEIVAAIDGYQKVIDGAKQVTFNWSPQIKANSNWETVTLEEVAEVSSGNSAPQNKALFRDGKHPFCRTSDVGRVHISDNLTEIKDYLNDEGIGGLRLFKKNTILFPKSGASTFLNHRVILGLDSYVSSHLATIYADSNKIFPQFLFYALLFVDAKKLTAEQAYPSLKLSEIGKIKIPLPSLEEQKRIVAEIESEQQAVNHCKTLIEKMEKKIADKIGEIYNGKL